MTEVSKFGDYLDALGDTPTADEARSITGDFDPADALAVVVERLSTAGGGGGSAFTGWTADEADPANVTSNGGNLDLGAGAVSAETASIGSMALGSGASQPQLSVGTDAPSITGRTAPLGSIHIRKSGELYQKTASGDTDWSLFGTTDPSAYKVVRVPFAFDTPNILTDGEGGGGIVVYTPTAGDTVLDVSYLSITEGFDGSNPNLWLYSQGGDYTSESMIGTSSVQSANAADSGPRTIVQQFGGMFIVASSGQNIVLTDTTPLVLVIDDGAGGDPESAQGAGEIVLVIASSL